MNWYLDNGKESDVIVSSRIRLARNIKDIPFKPKLSKDDIEQVVGEKIANSIIAAREGKLGIQAGGGGVYGKVTTK